MLYRLPDHLKTNRYHEIEIPSVVQIGDLGPDAMLAYLQEQGIECDIELLRLMDPRDCGKTFRLEVDSFHEPLIGEAPRERLLRRDYDGHLGAFFSLLPLLPLGFLYACTPPPDRRLEGCAVCCDLSESPAPHLVFPHPVKEGWLNTHVIHIAARVLSR